MLRHVGLSLALAIAASGCHRFDGETWIFPLDELNAELRIGGDSRATAAYSSSMVQLYIVGNTGDYCRIVSPRHTRATMNGVVGEVFPGEEYRGFYDEDNCIAPQFGWDTSPTGTVEIVISDDSASWTFVAENPFDVQYPRVQLLSHDETTPIKSGDMVRLEVMTVHSLSGMSVYMREGPDTIFEVNETSGLTVTGNELTFVMPPVTMERTGRLSVAGYVNIDFTQCDAPYGCRSEYPFNDSESATLAP